MLEAMASKLYTSVSCFSLHSHPHTHTHISNANPSVYRLLLFLFSVLLPTLSLLFIFIIALILMALAKRFVHRTQPHRVELNLYFGYENAETNSINWFLDSAIDVLFWCLKWMNSTRKFIFLVNSTRTVSNWHKFAPILTSYYIFSYIIETETSIECVVCCCWYAFHPVLHW